MGLLHAKDRIQARVISDLSFLFYFKKNSPFFMRGLDCGVSLGRGLTGKRRNYNARLKSKKKQRNEETFF